MILVEKDAYLVVIDHQRKKAFVKRPGGVCRRCVIVVAIMKNGLAVRSRSSS
jgi:hypothetical protein